MKSRFARTQPIVVSLPGIFGPSLMQAQSNQNAVQVGAIKEEK
jgi:hypothetical protein